MKGINKYITRCIFSLYNLLHGGRLKELYRKIEQQNESDEPFNTDKLKNYLASWSLDKDIQKLPIMTKEDLRILTSKLDKTEISSFVYTGGSTGEPLKVPYSKDRELMRTARIAYYNQIAGYQIGDRFLIIRAKSRSKIMQWLRNELLFIPQNISYDRIKEVSEKIIEQKAEVLIGYPTVIYEIALFLAENNLKSNHRIKSIITVSEPIDDLKRTFIYEVFGCILIDRYSNEEVGVIAQQYEFGGDYIVDKFGVFVEVLDPETLQPVKENEIGKVVVTDIYNDLIPVIRYDTGDYAMVSQYRNGQLYSIKQIIGRTTEQIFATDGTPVSSLSLGPIIHQPFSEADLTCQFQFAQIGKKDFQLRIKGEKNKLVIINNKVTKGLKKVLGIDANIEILYVSNIKPLASGKRPLYRNETIN